MISADDVYFASQRSCDCSGHQERKLPDIEPLGKRTLAKAFTLDTAIFRTRTNSSQALGPLSGLCRIITPVYCRYAIAIGL